MNREKRFSAFEKLKNQLSLQTLHCQSAPCTRYYDVSCSRQFESKICTCFTYFNKFQFFTLFSYLYLVKTIFYCFSIFNSFLFSSNLAKFKKQAAQKFKMVGWSALFNFSIFPGFRLIGNRVHQIQTTLSLTMVRS